MGSCEGEGGEGEDGQEESQHFADLGFTKVARGPENAKGGI